MATGFIAGILLKLQFCGRSIERPFIKRYYFNGGLPCAMLIPAGSFFSRDLP